MSDPKDPQEEKSANVKPFTNVQIVTEAPPVHVQEQQMQAIESPSPFQDATDPSTGHSIDVIKTGSCASGNLGDTRPQLPDPVVENASEEQTGKS